MLEKVKIFLMYMCNLYVWKTFCRPKSSKASYAERYGDVPRIPGTCQLDVGSYLLM
jgi:hypothetical protein